MKNPLVSILIPNYNYGHYFENCLNSVLNQTYDHFEVIIRDNNSTDNSYEIACKYRDLFQKRGVFCSVTKNKRNVGSDKNSELCRNRVEGELYYTLASDDAIREDFLEKTVNVFTNFPNVRMVMTNRCEFTDEGKIIEVPPFYNCNCVIDGNDQAAVFMMAGIAIPAQRIEKLNSSSLKRRYQRGYRVAGDWYYNYLNACFGDIAYLTDPLAKYRVHPGNETNESEKNMLGVFEHFILINEFSRMAETFKNQKAASRKDEAIRKLAGMCIRYSLSYAKKGEIDLAKKYLLLAPAFDNEILQNMDYLKLTSVLKLDRLSVMTELAGEYWQDKNTRVKSYDPPEGSIRI